MDNKRVPLVISSIALLGVLLITTAGVAHWQRGQRGRGRSGATDRSEYPMWETKPGYQNDVFTGRSRKGGRIRSGSTSSPTS